MSYLVLARKWRPRGFDELVGQPHVARVLKNAIARDRIAHCYLFTGVRGVGKTSAARILAKALNCESGPTAVPCDACAHCREIAEGRAIDVYEIDGASNRGIDEVRQIIENVRYRPAKARFKIYIIDEVHQVTRDAFNALLKTLEEPPSFAKFVLATTEVQRLPETILSRCQRFDFRRIRARDIYERLRQIAEEEGLAITEGALRMISREAQGSMRDAQSLLEQVLSFGDAGGSGEKSEIVDEPLLLQVLGVAERSVLHDLSEGVIRGEPQKCLEVIARVADQGVDLAALSRELVEHFRNLLVVRILKEGSSRAAPGPDQHLLDLTAEELEALRQQVRGVPVATLTQYYRLRAQDDEIVARSPYPRFDLEISLVRLATMPHTVDVTDALRRLERIQKTLQRSDDAGRGGNDPGQEAQSDAGGEEAWVRSGPDSSASGADPVGAASRSWDGFLRFVDAQKKFLAVHLQQARPLEVSETRLGIGIMDGAHMRYLRDAENFGELTALARQFFSPGIVVTLQALSGESQDSGDQTAAGQAGDPEDLVQEALRIFGGSLK